MKNILGTLLLVIGVALSADAQIPDGSIAPDFVLTDLDGDTHHLYDYLDQGKVVFIKFFACHCPSCWAYHNTGKLEDLYQMYGPDGTDQIRVLMIEHDEFNGDNEFYGISGFTQGDWVTGNTIPKINAEGADRTVFADYNMVYYPMIFKICPDKTTEQMFTNYSVADLYQKADDCPGNLAIEDAIQEAGTIYVDNASRQLILDNFEDLSKIQLINSMGQQVYFADGINGDAIDLSTFRNGVYFVRVENSTGIVVKKISLQ